MERDLQRALDGTAEFAQYIYPALLEGGGLAALLRSAGERPRPCIRRGRSRFVPALVARTVNLCWLDMLEHHRGETRATLTVREAEDALVFKIVGDTAHAEAGFERLRDRVEALGGHLTVGWGPGRGTRISGSLPLSRWD